jgi:hypothetical protein
MLLPALKSAKMTAQAISCTGNGRQLMLAMTNYLGDFNDIFPPQSFGITTTWAEQLCPYLGMTYDQFAIPRSSVFSCPSQILWPGNFMRISYAYNSYLFGGDDYACVNGNPFWGQPRTPPPPIRISNIKSPCEQLVFVDGWSDYTTANARSGGYPYLENGIYFGLRHMRRCNVVYMAGNVNGESKAYTMDSHPANYPINATCRNQPYSFLPSILITDYSPY